MSFVEVIKMGKLIHEDLYKLNWIKILRNAIDNRRSSLGKFPVIEWRNASDEICLAVIKAMEEAGIITENRIYFQEDSSIVKGDKKCLD